MVRTREGSDVPAAPSQLDRLRQHERRLATRLEEAQARAERLIDEERARIDAARSELADEIRRETARIRSRTRAAAEEESEAILASARTEAERLAAVPDSRVAELAEGVFRRLFSGQDVP